MATAPFSDHSYEGFLQQRKIMGTRCRRCGALALPPRSFCVAGCGGELEWFSFAGIGRLSAFTSIFVPTPAMARQGFGRNNPYVVGVVELREGPRIVARIVGVDAEKPSEIKVGTPLRAEFLTTGGDAAEHTVLAFVPSDGEILQSGGGAHGGLEATPPRMET